MQLNWYYLGSIIFIIWCLRHFSEKDSKNRIHFLWILTLLMISSYLINLIGFLEFAHPLTLLPLQLCNMGVILTPIALKTQHTTILDFLCYACGCGALAAILIVSKEYQQTYSLFTFTFYVFHFLIFLIPLLLSTWGFYALKPTFKNAKTITLILMVVSLLIHGFNVFLNQFEIPANYFFTIQSLSIPTNKAFEWFASLIPFDYFYMYLVFPILYLYMYAIKKIVWFFSSRPLSRNITLKS